MSIFAISQAQTFETVVKMDSRPGNLAVSSKGEIYTTMHPMENPEVKIMRFSKKGKALPFKYPVFLKAKPELENIGIVDTIGIFITKKDVLWVLDMGGKVGQKMVSPKFIVWDLKKNKLEKIITISQDVLVSNSFLQDFAIDEENDFVFIADMTIGLEPHSPAIIAIDLKTGEMKRRLNNSKFLQANVPLVAENKIMKSGDKPSKLGLNPITIDEKNEWVYFGAMSEGSIFRIKTKALEDFSLSDAKLEKAIQDFGYKPHSDGFKIDSKGNIYVGDVEKSEIGINHNKKYRSYIKSPELIWVDGLFVGNDGYVYGTVNQLNRHPGLSGEANDSAVKPFKIIKFKQAN